MQFLYLLKRLKQKISFYRIAFSTLIFLIGNVDEDVLGLEELGDVDEDAEDDGGEDECHGVQLPGSLPQLPVPVVRHVSEVWRFLE